MGDQPAISYQYDPESPERRYMHKHVVGQWRSLTEMFSIGVMLVFLYFIVRIALRESGDILAGLHPSLLRIVPMVFWGGIVLGLAAAYLCGLLVSRLHQTIYDIERDGIYYRTGPISVTLDENGIQSGNNHFHEHVGWGAVKTVVETPQGLAIRLDNATFVPVLDATLPPGRTRADTAKAIRVWMAAGRDITQPMPNVSLSPNPPLTQKASSQ